MNREVIKQTNACYLACNTDHGTYTEVYDKQKIKIREHSHSHTNTTLATEYPQFGQINCTL